MHHVPESASYRSKIDDLKPRDRRRRPAHDGRRCSATKLTKKFETIDAKSTVQNGRPKPIIVLFSNRHVSHANHPRHVQ